MTMRLQASLLYRFGWLLLLSVSLNGAEQAQEPNHYTPQREEVFEFTESPRMAGDGDRFEINFTSKGYCDATVVVEDKTGRIRRHLASGVLGANAPEPFQKNALQQHLIWDGKDDMGVYLDDKPKYQVRVSLGLKPRFEKSLWNEPHRRLGNWRGGSTYTNTAAPLIQPAPEGVYIYEGSGVEQLRLFDHQGNYVRTVYPFPASKLKEVQGLDWFAFPQDGAKLPRKMGFVQATLLPSGSAGQIDNRSASMCGASATAMALWKDRIALAMHKLSRLGTDGSSGGLPLGGPKVTFPAVLEGGNRPRGTEQIGPLSIAFSPDGKWLYLTGYMWREHSPHHSLKDCMHGVARMDYAGVEEPKLFAGSLKQGDSGSEPGRFTDATSVACDSAGNVYVSDFMNDRIQVFSPDGKFLKAIPVQKPARISLNSKTEEIYVFSWLLANDTSVGRSQKREQIVASPALTVLGPLSDPKVRATYPLPIRGVQTTYGSGDYLWGGVECCAEVNTHVNPPQLWLIPSLGAGFQIYDMQEGKLTLKRDLHAETTKRMGKTALPEYWRQRLFVNPQNGNLWLAEQHTAPREKGFREMVEFDPAGSGHRVVQIPFDAEDIAFGPNGLIHMRDHNNVVARYDPQDWREVPYDYGEERENVTADVNQNARKASVISGLPIYNGTAWHKGGMSVSVKGNLVFSCYVTKGDHVAAVARRTDDKYIYWGSSGTKKAAPDQASVMGNAFQPRYYPGRVHFGEVHVWDKHGKPVQLDILPGCIDVYGVGIDKDDNIYTMMSPTGLLPDGKRKFNEMTGTLMKALPGRGKVICEEAGPHVQIPLSATGKPDRPAEGRKGSSNFWFDGVEWLYGGVGFCGKNATYAGGGCACWNSRFTLDYLGRSFAPEIDRYAVAVLDSNGNLILRVGRYGNFDSAGPKSAVPLGGDEVGIFHAPYVATHTDKRLFIADPGNQRITSVVLDYHQNVLLPLPAQDSR